MTVLQLLLSIGKLSLLHRKKTSFLSAMPAWIKDKLFFKKQIQKELRQAGIHTSTILFPEHHLSHAASAFYPLPFNGAAIITVDGMGEWATITICKGVGSAITLLKELTFPHSMYFRRFPKSGHAEKNQL